MITRYEYRVVQFDTVGWFDTQLPRGFNDYLDQVGQDGWELVSTEALTRNGYTRKLVAIFKRPSP